MSGESTKEGSERPVEQIEPGRPLRLTAGDDVARRAEQEVRRAPSRVAPSSLVSDHQAAVEYAYISSNTARNKETKRSSQRASRKRQSQARAPTTLQNPSGSDKGVRCAQSRNRKRRNNSQNSETEFSSPTQKNNGLQDKALCIEPIDWGADCDLWPCSLERREAEQ